MGKDVLSVGAALSSPVTQLVGTASPGREMARPYALPLLWPGPLSGNPRVFGGRAMAIYRRLQKRPLAESGHLFAAYELTLRTLHVVDRNDAMTAMIADKIIEIGATGLEDAAEISKRAVKFFTFN